MINILKTIFTSGASKLVESVGTAIDKNVTSKEERLKLKNDFTEIIQKHDYKLQEELTERHKIDMTADNKLSKLIRPMTLIYMTTFLSGIILADALTPLTTEINGGTATTINGITTTIGGIITTTDNFTVGSEWIGLLTILLVTVFSFYFGGRELQKWLINKKM